MTRKTLGISRDTEATKASRSWAVTGVRLERLKERARTERANPTEAQRLLWSRLANGKLGKTKFRQQAVVGSAVVDFASPYRWIVIELTEPDDNLEVTALQDGKLADAGIRVLRFTEADVIDDIEGVLNVILEVIETPFDRRPSTAAAFMDSAD
jgi:hypothetical protein